jgi:hypothetical protein
MRSARKMTNAPSAEAPGRTATPARSRRYAVQLSSPARAARVLRAFGHLAHARRQPTVFGSVQGTRRPRWRQIALGRCAACQPRKMAWCGAEDCRVPETSGADRGRLPCAGDLVRSARSILGEIREDFGILESCPRYQAKMLRNAKILRVTHVKFPSSHGRRASRTCPADGCGNPHPFPQVDCRIHRMRRPAERDELPDPSRC